MAQDKKKDKGPAVTSAAYEAMLPTWEKIQCLLDGTESMRAAGRTYLPQHHEESDHAYAERLGRCTLLNMLAMTLDAWVGKPFSEPIKVGEDVPPAIQELLSNVDLRGNSIDVFCRNWFREGLAKGFSHVYVDFPRTSSVSADGGPRTLADDRAEQVRPYLIKISPENLFFGYVENVNGTPRPTHIRILESVTTMVGFEEQTVRQIRVVTPGLVKVYQEFKEPNTKKVVWKVVDEYTYDLDFIPLVTFYADEMDEPFKAKAPLSDLADLNIRHWQSTSDQIAVLTVARFPILGVSGAVADDEITVGPHGWLHCPDPAGRFYYVEHTGKAIAAGRQDILDLEENMAEYGATFLKKRPGGASATARALDVAETTSPLQDMAIRFQSAMSQAIALLGNWIGLKATEVGTLTVNTDFDFSDGDLPALQAIQAARQLKDISRPRFLQELHRMRVIGEDFDEEKNDAELLDEQKAQLKQQIQTLKVTAKYGPKPAAPGQKGGANDQYNQGKVKQPKDKNAEKPGGK